jgi:MFS family permease
MRNTLTTIFRALRYRNFRLFFAGQSVSLIGTWMQQVAMSWLVYRLTGSAFMLGVVGFAAQIPTFLFSPFTGVLADRYNRHRILILTQTLSMIQAFILAALSLTGVISVWHVIVLGLALGCVNAIDIPARQSFIIDMVERKEMLGNAIALNSLMFNSARLIGPSVAGILIAIVGEGVCFLINGVSFLGVIAGLLAMNMKGHKARPKSSHVLHGLMEGVKYTFGFAPIRHILALLSVISIMGMSYVVLMPVFAKNVLGGGPSTLGFLMASGGAGAIAATVFLASRRRMLRLGHIIPVSSSIFAVGLILFSFSRVFWLSATLLAVTGFGFMVHMAASNTVIQTIVEDDKRGRVMSFYAMAFLGVAPFGSLLAGTLASRIGATNTLIIGSATCMFAAVVFSTKLPALRKAIHPIYRKMGIIPEVASGIGTVTGMAVPPED